MGCLGLGRTSMLSEGMGVLHCHLGRTAAVVTLWCWEPIALNSNSVGRRGQKPPQLVMLLPDLACWRCLSNLILK